MASAASESADETAVGRTEAATRGSRVKEQARLMSTARPDQDAVKVHVRAWLSKVD